MHFKTAWSKAEEEKEKEEEEARFKLNPAKVEY